MTREEINYLQEYIHNLIQNRKNIGQEPTGDDLYAVLGHLEILKESQPSLPSVVNEAAKEYASTQLGNEYDEYFSVDINILEAFKSGAGWMAKQGKVFEGEINAYSDDGMKYIESTIDEEDVINTLGLNIGDKVIVQIRKL